MFRCSMKDCIFFFKQKTAYEMRISDWSSDVCSSDLAIVEAFEQDRRRTTRSDPLLHSLVELAIVDPGRSPAHSADQADFPQAILPIPFGLSLTKSRPSVLSLEGRTVLRKAQDERKQERKSTPLNTNH